MADINGDGLPEALETSGVYDVHGVDINGREATGWPKFTNGWTVQTPAVGDVDGDGLLEVIATTREGNLFVWRTSGDECGFIPWRRWHHDEWGSGNYHTDARPPAALRPEDVTPTAQGPLMLRLDLARVPGDGLFCGTAAFEVRVAETPITDEASFAAAAAVHVSESPVGRRAPGTIVVTDSLLVGRTLYIGLIARDAAGNRSPLVPLGPVTFNQEEPPSATPTATVELTSTPTVTRTPIPTDTAPASPTNTAPPTATGTASPTPTSPGTATSTVAPATPTVTGQPRTATATAPATATATASAVSTSTQNPTPVATNTSPPAPTATRPHPSDSGCSVVSPAEVGGAWWLLLAPGIVLVLRRRTGGCRSAAP